MQIVQLNHVRPKRFDSANHPPRRQRGRKPLPVGQPRKERMCIEFGGAFDSLAGNSGGRFPAAKQQQALVPGLLEHARNARGNTPRASGADGIDL
ncbi:hypothetical protein SDC9_143262 [bioreactor metagenome]|uniref:Uncharacterized protein n=1 Tax=bioreactor metagenome TaxID=1076179 RepID=A0A645E3L3_9ZZZZ